MSDTIGYPDPLMILAFDHRSSFAREVIGSDDPDPSAQAKVREAKLLVFEGLVAAAESGVAPANEIGVLVDEQYGSAIPPLASARGLKVAVAVERSGQKVFDFEYGDQFAEHIESMNPDFAKVLVRLNVEGDAADNRTQLERLERLGDSLREHGRKFLFELLVPPTDDQLGQAGGDTLRFEREQRPALIVRAMERIQEAGIEPDVWKLEGVDEHDQAAAIVSQARREARWAEVGCVVLGAGADDERVEGWLRIAAATEGFEGFAIGRSIWRAPLVAHLAGEISRDQAVDAVRDAFARFCAVYENAAG